MNDPHVVSLKYKVNSPKNVDYSNAPLLKIKNNNMDFELSDNLLTIKPDRHFNSIEKVRKVIEPFLRAWEINTGIENEKIQIRFEFMNAQVIDRNPKPNPNNVVLGATDIRGESAMITKASLIKQMEYPKPPTFFELTPDVETLWNRFQGYVNGQEPLTSMAYFCLSLCENKSGGRSQFGVDYKIEDDILNKIGEFSSTKGDESEARKINNQSTLIPLTEKEKNWLEKAVRFLIQRMGQQKYLSSLPEIEMGDLPPLK